jgi:uncharacterized protein YbjT (DUF2867 family)
MILVVGATGLLGGMITRRLLAQGKTVQIVVRPNSPSAELARAGMATSAQELIDAGAQPVAADLKDRASLNAACAGVKTVITTANAALRGGDDTFQTVDLEGTSNLIAAARAAGVQQFIYTSAFGATPGHPHPLFNAKGQSETTLKASGLTYTILQPTIFMEVWIPIVVGMPLRAGQPVTLVGEGGRKQAFVAVGDVAACAVAAVENPRAYNQTIMISDPTTYSWTEVTASVGRAIGQSVPVQYVAPGAPIPLLPEAMAPMLYGMELADTQLPAADGSAALGVTPTRLATFTQHFFGNHSS